MMRGSVYDADLEQLNLKQQQPLVKESRDKVSIQHFSKKGVVKQRDSVDSKVGQQLYDYYQTHADDSGQKVLKAIEINSQIRQYDLQHVRSKQLSLLQTTLTDLKDSWQQIKVHQQDKLKFIEEIKSRH